MIAKAKKDIGTIYLSAGIKKLIKIGINYYKLIIGKTKDKYIFIRLIIDKMKYENLFTFRNEDYNDIYKKLLDNNNPSYKFKAGKGIIYLTYSLENITQDIIFKLIMKSLGITINNSNNIKINYNNKLLSDEKMIILSNASFNNQDFEYLCEIEINATFLNLENNNISDLSQLKSENIKYLQKLNLSNNKIESIDVIDKLKLINLKELMLNDNKIEDISVLEKIKLNNLEILYLKNNSISNIEVLENVKFENLIKLDLSKNKINDISVLENAEFSELIELNLSNNNIKKILIKTSFSFPKLKTLNLMYNLHLEGILFIKIDITHF